MNNYTSNHPTMYKTKVVDVQELKHKNKKHNFYKISVSSPSRSWDIQKRYKEIEALYSDLKARNIITKSKIPPKIPLINRIGTNKSSKRLKMVDEFLSEVCQLEKAFESIQLRQFLKIDNPPSTPSQNSIASERSVDGNTVENNVNGMNANVELPTVIKINADAEDTHIKPTDFEFLKTIGKGSYGNVFMARHKEENKVYAIKVLAKSYIRKKNEVKHVMAERNVMVRVIRHPFIVRMHYSFQTSDKLYFVVDFINGGELFYHLQKECTFSEPRARFYSAEITSAIGYLHSIGIIYRDLKPENILLDSEGHIKLTDFGLCKEGLNDNEEKTSTFCGTPEYLAPEIIKKQSYTKAVDWWTFGAVLYEMLSGLPPFYNKNSKIMHDDILTKPLTFRGNVSYVAKDILQKLLTKNGSRRLGAGKDDVLEIKRHRFYQDVDWNLVDTRKIRPPITYPTTDRTDLRFIDPIFVEEPVPTSVKTSKMMSQSEVQSSFSGFTYVNRENMADSNE